MAAEELNESNLVEKAMSAFRWVAALRFLGQMVSWLSTIFVIRFLAPEDYGIISLAEVLRTFLVFFSVMGLGQGLMKVKDLTPQLVQKTLGLMVLINVSLFVLQFFSAPYIARFYETPQLELVLQVLAFSYLFIPWTSIPSSLIARELNHKRTSQVTLVSNVLASALSLTLAYMGYGYWALVAAIIFTMVFNCVCFNLILSYPRIPSFHFKGTKEVFSFGAFIAMSDIFYVAYNKVDVAVAGKYFTIAEVGFYGVALQLATMLMSKSIPLFNVVAFPAFARMNAISGDSNEYLVTTLRFAATMVFPVFFGVAMVGEDLILLVLGANWVQISGIFTLLVISVPVRILAYVITPAILAAGGARLDMLNSLITLAFLTVALVLLLPLGLEGVAVAWSLASLCLFGVTVVRGGRLLNLPVKRVLAAAAPALVASIVMCLSIHVVNLQLPDVSPILSLYKIPLGICVYIAFSWLVFRQRSEELIRVTLRLMGRA
ncbi:MAG: oligosaccharide flippase family protein [Halioglobus sp.]|nr:oligosaccharide flippase family protein [Halieaceae bacterium]MDG2410566.1 oligosaccharide flippase family protein [Halioglobus sp.]